MPPPPPPNSLSATTRLSFEASDRICTCWLLFRSSAHSTFEAPLLLKAGALFLLGIVLPLQLPVFWGTAGAPQERKLVHLLEKPLRITALTEQASVRPAVDYPVHHHPYPTLEQETPEYPRKMGVSRLKSRPSPECRASPENPWSGLECPTPGCPRRSPWSATQSIPNLSPENPLSIKPTVHGFDAVGNALSSPNLHAPQLSSIPTPPTPLLFNVTVGKKLG